MNLLLTFTVLLRVTHSSCWINQGIQSGNISFGQALSGVEVKIALYDDGLPWTDYDAETKTFTGGYSVDIVNALADTAGFIPNITLLEFLDGETYTEAAQRALLTHDCAGAWFTDAAERRLLDMNFAHHFVDATMVLVIPIPKYEEKKFSLTAFLEPFTPGLWILIVAGIIFNAICSFLFSILSNPSTQIQCKQCFKDVTSTKQLCYEFGSYLYTSFGHFTAAGDGFEPNTIFSRINTIMWSFLVVIVLASYTANLATALISEANVAASLDTVEAINSAGKTICAPEAGIEGVRIKTKWPNLNIFNAYLNSGSFLRNGTCAGVLLGATDASVLLARNCDMQLTIERVFPGGGSFVFQNDEDRCGGTIQKLFDYYFVRMEEEGILDELWAKQVDDIECEFNAPDIQTNDEDDIKLSVVDLGGLSLLYAIGAFLLLIVNTIAVMFCKKKNVDINNSNTDNPDRNIETELTTHVQINTDKQENVSIIQADVV